MTERANISRTQFFFSSYVITLFGQFISSYGNMSNFTILSQGCNAAECPGHPEDAGTGSQDEAPADLHSHLHSLRQL